MIQVPLSLELKERSFYFIVPETITSSEEAILPSHSILLSVISSFESIWEEAGKGEEWRVVRGHEETVVNSL